MKAQVAHHPAGPSRLGRIRLCPGSLHLSQEAERLNALPKTSGAAEEGTLLHSRVFPHEEVADLTVEQQRLVLLAREYVEEKFKYADGTAYEELLQIKYERRILTFGTSDAVAFFEGKNGAKGRVVVVDFKFGYDHLEPKIVHPQLEAYAVAAMQEYDVDYAEAYAFHVRSQTEYQCEFYWADCYLPEIARVIDHAERHPAELHPSISACKYCPARAICPALKSQVAENALIKINPLAIDELMLPEKISEALQVAGQASVWADAVKGLARDMAIRGVEIPGYELRERNVRRVNDVAKAYEQLAEIITQEEFLSYATVTLGGVEDAAARKLGEREGVTIKDAKSRIKSLLASVVAVDTQKYLARKGV